MTSNIDGILHDHVEGLSELKIFLRGPHTIYFDLKKVLGDAIELFNSPKSGEINKVFKYTC